MQKPRNYLLWFGAALLLLFLFLLNSQKEAAKISWDKFLNMVEKDQISRVVILNNRITAFSSERKIYTTLVPPGETEHLKVLREHHVTINVEEPSEIWSWLIFLLIPAVFLIIFFFFMRRRLQGGGGKRGPFGMMNLGSKQVKASEVKTTFADVAGIDEVKEELIETVEYLRDPQKFERLGGRVPRGLLLVGAPGTGKTLLGRAVAGEANASFFYISGSEFVEMFVGVGASRVRELFEHARKATPCIVFIDEIDAVGRSRGAGLGNSNDEREQTLNQLLVEMDGFQGREAIVIIAATNRPDILDPALLRPGRFDRHIIVPMPDLRAREAILRVHVKKITLGVDVDLSVVARALPAGFTGADIENVVNEAALLAARANKPAVTQSDLIAARDRVIMGPERRTTVLTGEERDIVAYHEAGHAVVATFVGGADPVHRVTIVPHGMALGVTMMLPERDRYLKFKERLFAEICVCYGGRAAEEMVFGKISSGASNDFSNATQIARDMVMRYGMSELGERTFGTGQELLFLGRDLGGERNYSEETAREIDCEVKNILAGARKRVNELLAEHVEKLHALARALLERETVEFDELKVILGIA